MKKKILVRGPVLSRSGYGEQARFALRALRRYEDEYEIYLVNIPWGKTSWVVDDNEERRWIDLLIIKTQHYIEKNKELAKQIEFTQPIFDMSLQITIPNEWQDNFAPINIGYTAGIETNIITPEWIEKSSTMDKIIVVSEHAKSGFVETSYEVKNNKTGELVNDYRCDKTPEVVHYPVRKFKPAKIDLDLTTDFNFLAVAQWGIRKNLENTIKWFVEEFIDQEVGLVVKTNIMNNCTMDAWHTERKLENLLSEYSNRKCKVYLIHGDMTDEEMSALYNHKKIKALVTLTHGEGFGLPIFESAYYGLPVVAPDWSGQCDYLHIKKKEGKKKKKRTIDKAMFAKVDYDVLPVQKEAVWDKVLSADSMWCFPRQGSYKMRLREVYKNYDFFKEQANELAKYVNKNFKEEDIYDLFVSKLNIEKRVEAGFMPVQDLEAEKEVFVL